MNYKYCFLKQVSFDIFNVKVLCYEIKVIFYPDNQEYEIYFRDSYFDYGLDMVPILPFIMESCPADQKYSWGFFIKKNIAKWIEQNPNFVYWLQDGV